jgi:hypothetical protein
MTGRPEMTAAASATSQATALYVYGVIPVADARGWPATCGVDGPPQPSGRSRRASWRRWSAPCRLTGSPGGRDDLETHGRVLSLANERGTTIPMPFGVVIDSEQLVREELLSRHAGSWNHDPRGDGTCCRIVCLALTAGVALGTSTASGAVVTAEPSGAIVCG